MTSGLRAFVAESNRIEGITRPPRKAEVEAHEVFLALGRVTVPDVERFVASVAGASLRDKRLMNVRVGGHIPPYGGPEIGRKLAGLLNSVNDGRVSSFGAHVEYEKLHPFMDGNGRSGRVLWAWMMQRDGHDPFALPFLHAWYYQSLAASR